MASSRTAELAEEHVVDDATYTQDDLLAAVVEFVRGLDLADVTLVGESMGAVQA